MDQSSEPEEVSTGENLDMVWEAEADTTGVLGVSLPREYAQFVDLLIGSLNRGAFDLHGVGQGLGAGAQRKLSMGVVKYDDNEITWDWQAMQGAKP